MAKLFSPKSSPPPAPTPAAPMPDPMSPGVLEAKRKATEMQMARAGRASTLLSEGNSGAPYSAKTLGG